MRSLQSGEQLRWHACSHFSLHFLQLRGLTCVVQGLDRKGRVLTVMAMSNRVCRTLVGLPVGDERLGKEVQIFWPLAAMVFKTNGVRATIFQC